MNEETDYLIEFNKKKKKKIPLVIIFGGISGGVIIPVFEFKRLFENHINHFHFIFIRDRNKRWYAEGVKGLGNNIDEVVLSLKNIIKKEKKNISEIITIGTSMGGYASLLFGLLLNVNKIISFAPQTFLDEKNRIKYKDNSYSWFIPCIKSKKYLDLAELNFEKIPYIYIIYGDLNQRDHIHAERLKKNKHIKFIVCKDVGHDSMIPLRDKGRLDKLINYILPKKKILHIHYSGIVRNKILLKYLLTHYKVFLDKKGSVRFLSKSKIIDNKKNVKKQIIEIIEQKNNKFENIGRLWYFVIKDCDFFENYNRLILYEMEKQGVKHIDFRIKLGSHFDSKTNKKISIEKELMLFYKCNEKLYKKKHKSFKIICQISKSQEKKKVYNYFIEIISILDKNKFLNQIVCGFDIVGNEITGNSLYYYEDIIKEIKKRTKIPFYFHAGEHDTKKSIENIRFAIKYGGNRIGHGIYCIRDKSLMKIIKNNKIILEISPISNLLLNNLTDPSIYYRLYKYGIQLSINTDDPNKLNDSTLEDNENFLLKNGFTRKDINSLYERL